MNMRLTVNEPVPEMYTQIYPPPGGKGRGGGGVWMDDFMGCGGAGGLFCHQQWSPSWPPSWILPRIGNQVKTARNSNFLCFTWKITHKWALCMILAATFAFIVERSWQNMYFHPKMAWPLANYDVISCNYSNWPSLNLSQNVREGWTNSYWKRQVLTFYPLGKNSEKPYGEGMVLVRPRVNS